MNDVRSRLMSIALCAFISVCMAIPQAAHAVAGSDSMEPALRASDIKAALELAKTPQMQRAIAEARRIWLDAKGRDPVNVREDRLLTDDFNNRAFYVALISLNNDPFLPRVTQFGWQAFRGFGIDVPATGMTINNQDNVYYHVPVDGSSSYRLTGKTTTPGPSDFSFKLADGWPNMVTVDTLAGAAVVKEGSGAFTIIIDSDPANGRPNHLRSVPGKMHSLMIRETLGDWSSEHPHQYGVRRTGGPAAPEATPAADMSERAGALLIKYTKDMARILKRFSAIPMNTFTSPVNSGPGGGLAVQVNGEGQYRLRDDEALIVRLNPGKASYFNIEVLDPWGADLDVQHRTSELNNNQSSPTADGNYVYVISAKDPGIANWLNISGVPEGFLYTRFQGFPDIDTPSADSPAFPRLATSLVKFSDLAKLKGLGQRISPELRKAQLAARASSYLRRLPGIE